MARLSSDRFDGKLTLRGIKFEPCCSSSWHLHDLLRVVYVEYTQGKKSAYLSVDYHSLNPDKPNGGLTDYYRHCYCCGAKLEILPLTKEEYGELNREEVENCEDYARLLDKIWKMQEVI